MKPKDFKGSNRVLTAPKGMENCGNLYVATDGKTCVSCWKLSLIERLRILIGKPMWLYIISGGTQPPVSLEVETPNWLDSFSKEGKK